MQHTPFKRAIGMMRIISAALAAGMSIPAALASVGEYKSRGKGRGGHSGKKWGPWPSGKYARAFNGPRECQRRHNQMFRAGIRTAPSAYDRNAA